MVLAMVGVRGPLIRDLMAMQQVTSSHTHTLSYTSAPTNLRI
jgi:hypothetical protein